MKCFGRDENGVNLKGTRLVAMLNQRIQGCLGIYSEGGEVGAL
jgi:hypothetical protein